MTTTSPQLTAAAIRARLEDMLMADLLGPAGGEHEVLSKRQVRRVRDHYLVGMLAPRDVDGPVTEENEPIGAAGGATDEDGPEDSGVTAAPSLYPSSLGLTVAVDTTVSALVAEVSWGTYLSQTSAEGRGEEEGGTEWVREPSGGAVTVLLGAGGGLHADIPDREHPEVTIDGRWTDAGGIRLITVFLVNGQPRVERNVDESWLFQVSLALRAADGGPVFVGRPDLRTAGGAGDPEARELDMLYRDVVEFAVGHGVGVHVDIAVADPTRARRVSTRAVPACEVARTEAPPISEVPGLAGLVLDMRVLAEAAPVDLTAMLTPLLTGYATWIDDQEARLTQPAARLAGYGPEATANVVRARETLHRLEQGIALVGSDPSGAASAAFQFANRAMWLQRVHSAVAAQRARDPELGYQAALAAADVPAQRSWRVFQLAFVLVNLPGLTDPTHADRGMVDLLFFPTGGGKTEAYLGLTAYTLAIRRLQGTVGDRSGHDGVAVLMRYTLRLLTSQQFQRAAALMCACEVIRREAAATGSRAWGDVPFRLGMWVGGSVTPNREEEARIAVRTARRTAGRTSGRAPSPLALRTCPWCGAPLRAHQNLSASDELRRTLTFCGDELGICPFTAVQSPLEGLPLVTVDETIYRLLPSLLIATADKFAQLPWKGATRNLFGRADDRCERHGWRDADEDKRVDERDSHVRAGSFGVAKTVHGAGPVRPPDLIIQDELHLIAGSLGTLVGLYETAVDDLATWTVDGRAVRPKVIASTATVRRAAQQVQQLFWRSLAVFPPPVFDVDDSFFARQHRGARGRRYLGICARGVRLKAVEIRIVVALLRCANALFEEHGELVDPYMTLVGYFNAVRELAGMRRLVDDDVSQRLRHPDVHNLPPRRFLAVEELTSRAGSTEIPDVLQRLERPHRRDRQRGDARPVDVLLATNMIAVGVDVPRLGLMAVVGQPKSTAEYIQATSRVGRDDDRAPGLVVTIYNWARPRDLSHYETFEHYHQTFYKHVEGLSVTPFAPRALDRGLAAVLVSLVRHSTAASNPNTGAQSVDLGSAEVTRIRRLLMERAMELTSDTEAGTEVRQKIDGLLDSWRGRIVAAGARVSYDRAADGVSLPLLLHGEDGVSDLWTCPNSLRETEPTVNVLLEPGDESLAGAPAFTFASARTGVGDSAEGPAASADAAGPIDTEVGT